MQMKTLKQIARLGFMKEFGFAPAAASIVLLEADGTGEYIMVRIGSHEYQIYRKLQRVEYENMISAEYVYRIEKCEKENRK